jgi:hypothetical protein
MKKSSVPALLLWLLISCSWQLQTAHAQSLTLVLASAEDAPAADKLQALLEQPARRVRSSGAVADDVSAACRDSGVEYALLLDGAHRLVQLLRCRDQTLLTRVVASAESPPAPNVSAFIASELLALGADLDERVPRPARVSLRLRAAVELLTAAGLYAGAVRPDFSVGLGVAPARSRFGVFGELGAAPSASARHDFSAGPLALTRSDVYANVGVGYALGLLQLEAFGRLACALTSADYRADVATSASSARWLAGFGVSVQVGWTDWLDLTVNAVLAGALSRNDYQFEGQSLARDPAQLLQLSAGLSLRPSL